MHKEHCPPFQQLGLRKAAYCKGAATDSQHIEAFGQLHSITDRMIASACQEGHLFDVFHLLRGPLPLTDVMQ